MESDLSQAVQGIYVSSQTIFKNNQRHLFCSALDLLSSSWNTSKQSEIEVINNNAIQLFQDIINLVFDKDLSIQNSAIIALENGISTFGIKAIQSNPLWGRLRIAIITNYAQKIHKIRNEGNRHWSEIWCLLIRLLDSDILKGASTINTFLSIVELGFRSSDNLIRAESFTCWRLLIKIFTTYNEISSPKRMKLIAIPLKSSQSKSMRTAEVKLRVWWYLITCLKESISDYLATVLEPFLIFCFGSPSRSATGAAEQYTVVRQLALPCLLKILSDRPNDFLDRCLKELKLELLPLPVMSTNFLNEHWSLLLHTSCSAIRLYSKKDEESSENEQKMIEMLLRILVDVMVKVDTFCTQFCTELTRMIPSNPRSVVFVINIFSGNDLEPFQHFEKCVKALSNLIFDAKHLLPPAILNHSISNIYRLDNLTSFENKTHCLNAILGILNELNGRIADGFTILQLSIWLSVTNALFEFRNPSNCIEYTISIKKWILWPVHNYINIQSNHSSVYLDNNFFNSWEKLLINESSCNGNSRRILFAELNRTLQESIHPQKYSTNIESFFEAYVNAAISFDSNEDIKMLREVIYLLQFFYECQYNAKVSFNIDIFQAILTKIKTDQIEFLFNEIKSVIVYVLNSIRNSNSDASILRNLKRVLVEKLRSSNKTIFSKINEIFKEKDNFVFIPSVWSLKPEKLTERQKERLSEKSVIPALYNDMSQSQDKQIQPWTPNRNLLAKGETTNEGSEQKKSIGENENLEKKQNSKPKTENAFSNESRNEICTRTRKSFLKNKCKESDVVGDSVHNSTVLPITSQLKDGIPSAEGKPILPSHQVQNGEDNNDLEKKGVKCENQNNRVEGIEVAKLDTNVTKELSPKKHMLKAISLSSPPDRKLTNNSSSPTIRPKPPTGHLTGRGAQLINMIRNKKSDTLTQPTQNLKTNTLYEKCEGGDSRLCLGLEETNGQDMSDIRDLLIFSKRLPSPSASPSASILKRKMCLENIEDVNTDSPVAKRKRVSFHDPPVSTTKAYFREMEESKIKPKRCLVLDKYALKQGNESKHLLKRRSKLDSLSEIEKFASDEIYKLKSNSDKDEFTLKNNISDGMSESLDLQVDCDETKNLSSIDTDVILQFVSQQFSLNDVLVKYFSDGSDAFQNAKNLATFLSSIMTNPKIKSSVLEILSENHSKDFLDHAVQENLSSVVCDRLNLNSVIDFVLAKSAINMNCRNNLISQITVLFQNNKLETEYVNLIDNLLKSCRFNDEMIFQIISTIISKRLRSNGSEPNVSESAVDSSSNL